MSFIEVNRLIECLRGGSYLNTHQMEGHEDMPQIVDWFVDKPVSLIGLTLLAPQQFELSAVCGKDCGSLESPVQALRDLGGDSLIGYKIELSIAIDNDSFHANLALSYGGNGAVRGYEITVYLLSNISKPADHQRFLNSIINLFDLSGAVALSVRDGRVRFRRNPDLLEASKISFGAYGPESDIAGPMLTISGLDLSQTRIYCDRLLGRTKTKQIQFTEFLVMFSQPEILNAAASWMMQFYPGPWLQRYCGYKALHDAGGDVLEKLHQNEVIPLGILGAKKKVKGLGRNGVYADLFKEGDGWHVAFHYKEQEAGPKQRSASIEAIHDLMGMKLIEKTPETLWPHIFH